MTRTVISLLNAMQDIPAAQWDAMACPEAVRGRPLDPFTTHRFLLALETSTGKGTGWSPHPLVLMQNGQPVAAMPLFVKAHSQGEYIFDHGWAEAFERAGGRYYPKLQCAVPFTPVPGPRFLGPPQHRAALLEAAIKLTEDNGLSSLHITFCTGEEAEALTGQHGTLHRITQQYHWMNRGYRRFEDFLADLSSRKRKMIRKERETARGHGLRIEALTGSQIAPAHWDAFWQFYQDTGARKWGRPYLTRAFFSMLRSAARCARTRCLLILAERDGANCRLRVRSI